MPSTKAGIRVIRMWEYTGSGYALERDMVRKRQLCEKLVMGSIVDPNVNDKVFFTDLVDRQDFLCHTGRRIPTPEKWAGLYYYVMDEMGLTMRRDEFPGEKLMAGLEALDNDARSTVQEWQAENGVWDYQF